MRILLCNARLIGGTGSPAQDGTSLLVEGDTIARIGPAASDVDGRDAVTLDLAGRTVIPGLVEAHLHLSYNKVKQIADLDLNCPPEYSTPVSAKNAELALHCRTASVPWRPASSPTWSSSMAIRCATSASYKTERGCR
jgi:imidazolonepropionase-like amidohydrolase